MRTILDELYDYDLFHLTEIKDVDGAYKSAMDRLLKAETELLKVFPDCKNIFDEYQSADIDLLNLSNRNEFRKGFRAGTQLVFEMIKPIKLGSEYEQIQDRLDHIHSSKKKYVPLAEN